MFAVPLLVSIRMGRHAPLATLSAILALAYGVASPLLHEPGEANYALAVLKTSSIGLLAVVAFLHRSRLLGIALTFGALGDFLLALDTRFSFMLGASSFLIGHLFYIALFLRAGIGAAALRQPARLGAMAATVALSVVMSLLLIPGDATLGQPLMIYSAVLTLMTLASFTLPASRWLVMTGAVLFLISDGFVAASAFQHEAFASDAPWFSFAGWMIYWAAQACLCFGALGLHRAPTHT